MSIGPGPSLAGSAVEWAALAGTRSQDAKGDVGYDDCDGGPGDGGQGPGSGVCGSSDSGAGGTGWNGTLSGLGPGGGGQGSGPGSGPGGGGPGVGGGRGSTGANKNAQKLTYQNVAAGQGSGQGSGQGTGSDSNGYQFDSGIVAFDAAGTPCSPPENTGNCVCANTRISLYPQGCCEAWELRAGDVVVTLTRDGLPSGERIDSVTENVRPCVSIRTEDGRVLECSLSHPVMIPDETDRRGRQLLAGDVRVGDVVLLENGDSARISAMAPIREARVYQISLSGPNHVYLTNGIWSHNKLTVPSWPTSGVPQP